MQRFGRGAGEGADHLPFLRRTRPDALSAGLLHHCAYLPHLPGRRAVSSPIPVPKCKGEGRVLRERTVDAKVPAGVEDGTRIRFTGYGEGGLHGGPPGDLYVVLHVKEHPFFEREGNDLHCVMPVSFAQAALGAEISVPTLEGEHVLKVPEGTQSGTTMRIKRQGRADAERPRQRRPVRRSAGADSGQAEQAPARAAAGTGRH